jgi:cytochrome c-type biogenesis protein CcmH
MMFKFLLVAAVMAALAAAAVAVPLLRDRRSRLAGAAAAVFVVAAAAALYPLWSNWDWHPPPQGVAPTPQVAAMVEKLEKHLEDQPNDLDGWMMLARSYSALERTDDAIVAFGHAHRLGGPKNVEATLGLGEALGIKAGGEVTAQAAALFEEAVAQAPDNPRALFFGGFAAAVRGDRELARSRWQALKALNPPPEVVDMLDKQIASLDGAPGPAEANATLNLKIAPALQARLRTDVPLFVFAREPGAGGPPLAAKRLTTAAIGSQIQLSQADSMLPGHALAAGNKVSITARVSFSGQPMPAAGDLYGELTYDVGKDGPRDLIIDQVAQ